MKTQNKTILIFIIIVLLLMTSLFLTGTLSVTDFQTNNGLTDTLIQCSSNADCINNPELNEIKDIVFCSNTCKFIEPKPTSEGYLYE